MISRLPSPKRGCRSKTMTRSANRPYTVQEDSDSSDDEETKKESKYVAAKPAYAKTVNMPPTRHDNSSNRMTPFSQEEEELNKLERSGSLKKIVGNTSILSQELLELSQQTNQTGANSINPTSVGLVTPQEQQQEKATEPHCKTKIVEKKQIALSQNVESQPSQLAEQVQSSQLTAMSFLLDACDMITNPSATNANKQEICGVQIPDSYVEAEESHAPELSQVTIGTGTARSVSDSYRAEAAQAHAKISIQMSSPNKNSMTKNDARKPPVSIDVPGDTNLVVFKAPNRSGTKRSLPTASVAIQPVPTITLSSSDPKKKGSIDSHRHPQEIVQELEQQAAHLAAQKKKRKVNRQQEQRVAHELAQQAAELAAQTIASPEVAKNLLLSMALVRINPRAAPVEPPPRGTVITDGFFWGTYPPLEMLLRNHMREYYELSVTKCQSKHQQEFNNKLTIEVREEASKHGWSFASNFNNKVLRDRIRCFFKTHIQNAKKRLRTMVKNPTKKANAKALVAHLQLIQRYSTKDEQHKPIFNPVIGDYVKVDVPENVDQTTMRKIKVTSPDSSMDLNGASDEAIATLAARQVMSLGFVKNAAKEQKIVTCDL